MPEDYVQLPWLKPADPAAEYANAYSQGAQIQMEQNRLSAENARTSMEAQARVDTLARETEAEKQRIATKTSYDQQVLALRGQQLKQAKDVADAKGKAAAAKMAAQTAFDTDVANGVPIATALWKNPGASATTALNIQKEGDIHDSHAKNYAERVRHDQELEKNAALPKVTTVQDVPAVKPQAARTASTGIFGFGASQATPAIQASPTKKVTTVSRGAPGSTSPVPEEPDAAAAPVGTPVIPTVSSKDQYEALPSGAVFIDAGDGKKKKKK